MAILGLTELPMDRTVLPIQTPTLDRLARTGLRFNNFHTTDLYSPTRMCIKTGRNHHTCNTGSIMETAAAFPGNTGQLPNSVAPLAEMLRLNTAPARLASGTKRRPGRPVCLGPSIAGRPIKGLTSSMATLPDDIKAWDSLPAEHRKLFSRQAEVFAGFMEQTDHEVGRLSNAISKPKRPGDWSHFN